MNTGKNILNLLDENRSRRIQRKELFEPGRMAYIFDLEDKVFKVLIFHNAFLTAIAILLLLLLLLLLAPVLLCASIHHS